jgi:hypothetical protein
MYQVIVNGDIRCEVLGYSSPVTYRFTLRPRYPAAAVDSVWDEVAILDVTRLIGPSSREPIEYPIRWELITDAKGFGAMLKQAVEQLRLTGRLDPPPGGPDPKPKPRQPGDISRLVQELQK